ncbi:MAG: F0F1 ATP synthase subunit A [Prevotella sp.]|nr:F0F1 ATP synthase subunit A [Prevotella sp.]MBQ6031788.1 F0F1 ATP synthase subunit A [Prevotella sp.]MBQ6308202.1 F0F1 ATP synthase subunit A [Prevotella sp.]MBQ6657888.1 F0F1 ATP synthase subunit A [Prevotella sp.]MBQ7441047.1 F0F1 ATP synthase subunit A [Prevotella sp.]
MNRIKSILLILTVAFLPLNLCAAETEEAIDIPEIVLEHLSDAYEWHIAGDVSIPLPIILRSNVTGQWTFCTKNSLPSNYYFNHDKHGKIYEQGSDKRPLDLSITKSVCQIWIVVIVLIVVFLSCARWYKKHDCKSDAPKGFVGMMEMLVMMIHDDVVKACVGEKHYKKYAPYLLTVFFFILVTNLLGLLPVFPGGANVTGNINITFFLALCTMLLVNIFGNKEYWKEIFWPEVPLFLKAYPVALIPVIEVVGIITKPFALMVRLFANMMAGHAIILSFTCVIFLGWTLGTAMGVGLNLFSALMLLFMNCVELLVAFVQAYVFTLLSAVFIGLAHPEHHAE